ncbi:MAG: hypothetical protein JWQ19_356 [Subtercola sp.]|nr:hypothetical protein [Subtercola sp.]
MAVSFVHRNARRGTAGARRSSADASHSGEEYSVGVAKVPGAKTASAKTAGAKAASAKAASATPARTARVGSQPASVAQRVSHEAAPAATATAATGTIPAVAATQRSSTPVASATATATASATASGMGPATAATAVERAANDDEAEGTVVRRLFGATGRVIGIDSARGIAVVASVAGLAELVIPPHALTSSLPSAAAGVQLLEPATWAALAGSGSLLVLAGIVFAIVGGVSTSLLSGGYEGLSGVPQLQARLRTLVRAVLFVIGGFAVLATGYAIGRFGSEWWLGRSSAPLPSGLWATVVTLTVPAALFSGGLLIYLGLLALAELIFTRCGSALLFTVAAGCALVAPVVAAFVYQHSRTPVINAVAVFLPWASLYLAGMAIGRLRLDLLSVRLVLFGSGCALGALGFAGAWAVGRYALVPADPLSGSPLAILASAVWPPGEADALPSAALNGFASFVAGAPPSVFVVVGLAGIGLAVVAACLLVGSTARWVLLPLSAAGTLALSIGAVTVAGSCTIALAAPGSPAATFFFDAAARLDSTEVPGRELHWLLPVVVIVVVLLLATFWRLAFGSGLLERIYSLVTQHPGRGILLDSTFAGVAPRNPTGDTALASSAHGAGAALTETSLSEQPDFASLLTPPLPGARTSSAPAYSADATTKSGVSPDATPTPARAPAPAPTRAPTPIPIPIPTPAVPETSAPGAPTFAPRGLGDSEQSSDEHPRSSSPPSKPHPAPHPVPHPEPTHRNPPTISPVRSTWSPGQTLGRLPY